MKLSERLAQAVAGGIRQIGQVAISREGDGYVLRHIDDEAAIASGLQRHRGSAVARDLSTWAEDGRYRFVKSEPSLKRGWRLELDSAEELRRALDLLYPAAVGLWFAYLDGRLEVEHLRDKLDRQTGMYRFARNLSEQGAQRLVREIYDPQGIAAAKILWQIDAATPLEDSAASRFDGVFGEIERSAAIPLLSREACNHLVAEARKASKAEADQNARAR